jgi:hypothetical protein
MTTQIMEKPMQKLREEVRGVIMEMVREETNEVVQEEKRREWAGRVAMWEPLTANRQL